MATQKMTLGKFFTDGDGIFHGTVSGLGMLTTPVISQETNDREGKRYLKLIGDPLGAAYEIGAAFPKEKEGKLYYSVTLDSPFLASPIKAALFQDYEKETVFNLVWNREATLPQATPVAGQQQQRRYPSPGSTP